eukprot:scaffold4587_cov182-Amphora_coffeaeformis.AAC.5
MEADREARRKETERVSVTRFEVYRLWTTAAFVVVLEKSNGIHLTPNACVTFNPHYVLYHTILCCSEKKNAPKSTRPMLLLEIQEMWILSAWYEIGEPSMPMRKHPLSRPFRVEVDCVSVYVNAPSATRSETKMITTLLPV